MKSFFWALRYPHRWMQYYLFRMSRKQDAESSLSGGFAWGFAISFSPLLGIHIILTLICCKLHRKNIWAGIIGTLIGNPITFPFIWLLTYWLGSLILGSDLSGNTADLKKFFLLGTHFRLAVFNLDFSEFWGTTFQLLGDLWPLFKTMMLGFLILFLPIWFITNHIIYIMLVSIRAKKKMARIKK